MQGIGYESMANQTFTIEVSVNIKRFKSDLMKRIALSSASDINDICRQMVDEIGQYLTIGNPDAILDAVILEVEGLK